MWLLGRSSCPVRARRRGFLPTVLPPPHRVARRLLRIGGIGRGGFRGGVGGVGRFGGMRVGFGRRGRRGVGNNLATQQVLRSSYYGNPGTSGQIAYYGTSTVGK